MGITSIEAKFVLKPPNNVIEDDIHFVKEIVTEDNKTYPRLKLIQDFKRPVWVTKEFYRNHKQKKESEEVDKLHLIKTTEKDLVKNVRSYLGGRYAHAKHVRDLINSPYIYGLDIDSRAIIKHLYQKKYPDVITPYTLTTFDIEVNTDTDELIVVSIATKDKIYVCILESLIEHTVSKENASKQLTYLFNKYIPKTNISKNIVPEFEVCTSERMILKKIFAKLHEWKTDFIAVWNINYDIPYILKICGRNDIDPAKLFSSPEVEPKYRYFKYKEGSNLKVTDSGKHKPMSPEEQWHVILTPSYSYWIDAMSAHRFVRVGGKSVPGGYSLNNILEQELGKEYKKLHFDNPATRELTGIDWHKYMVKHMPLEYIIYNCWDTMSMVELDNKTKDLETNLPVLSGISSFDIFNSGPKKIVDTIHYFYLNHGRVLGCKPTKMEADENLGLGDWISILESSYVKDNPCNYIKECPGSLTNIRKHVTDSDAVSSYPSNILAANVSKDTTHREVIDIPGIDRLTFMKQNINLFFGKVNSVEYCTTMLNFPTLLELDLNYSKKDRT